MTSFNAAGVLMPLDEYYEKCVQPKVKIAPSQNRHGNGNKNRLAGRLRSYMDWDRPLGEDDDDEDVVQTRANKSIADVSESDQNTAQINFEMADFNKIYCEQEGDLQAVPRHFSPGRSPPNDANRQASNSRHARFNFRQRNDSRAATRVIQKRSKGSYRNNNWQPPRQGGGQQTKLSERRMRYAHDTFVNEPVPSAGVLSNYNNHFQNYQNALPTQGPMMAISYSSLINSVSYLSRVPNQQYLPGGIYSQPLPQSVLAQIDPNATLGELIGLKGFNSATTNIEDVQRNVELFLNTINASAGANPSQNFQNNNFGNENLNAGMPGRTGYKTFQQPHFG